MNCTSHEEDENKPGPPSKKKLVGWAERSLAQILNLGPLKFLLFIFRVHVCFDPIFRVSLANPEAELSVNWPLLQIDSPSQLDLGEISSSYPDSLYTMNCKVVRT